MGIGKGQRTADRGRPGIAIKHGDKLLTGDVAVGVRSIGHAVFPCPCDALTVILLGLRTSPLPLTAAFMPQ